MYSVAGPVQRPANCQREPGLSGSSSVCLFAQFDPTGRIAPHVLRYLSALSACGFVVHVACSGAKRLTDADQAALARIGAVAHVRRNRGLDFGAWQYLLRQGCASDATEVLLANDSVFGPFADLAPIFATMRARRLDAWGMVASTEGVWHLQSWFVCLTGAALRSPSVQRVLAAPFEQMSKAEIILHGELGLGAALRSEGFACAARHETPPRARLRRFARINPMHLDWATLLETGAVPFLKRELVRDNPIRIPWADRWPAVLQRVSHYPLDLITEQLTAADRMWHGTPMSPPRWRTLLLYLLLTLDKREALRAAGPTLARIAAAALRSPP